MTKYKSYPTDVQFSDVIILRGEVMRQVVEVRRVPLLGRAALVDLLLPSYMV